MFGPLRASGEEEIRCRVRSGTSFGNYSQLRAGVDGAPPLRT